jgi:hypothetical protein
VLIPIQCVNGPAEFLLLSGVGACRLMMGSEGDGSLRLTDQHHATPSSSGVEEVPAGTTGAGETASLRATATRAFCMPRRLATANPHTFSPEFGRSQCVGAHYGLTPRLYQSGETMRVGRISKCGDRMMRAALYEAALVLLTGSRGRWSGLKVWGLAVAKRRGMQIVERGAHHPIPALRDPPDPHRLAGLVEPRRQAVMHAEGPRGRCPQAGDRAASHVARREGLPLVDGSCDGSLHDGIRGSGRSHLSRALGKTGARVSSVSPAPVVPAGTAGQFTHWIGMSTQGS